MTNIELLKTCLKEYKTTAGKKAFLTREKKAIKQYIAGLEKYYKPDGTGYYLGERITIFKINGEKAYLKTIFKIYSEL